MYVTIQDLRDKHACEDRVAICASEWPDGAQINIGTLLRAVELGLDLHWFACNLLPAPLWAEYERQLASLLAAIIEGQPDAVARAWRRT